MRSPPKAGDVMICHERPTPTYDGFRRIIRLGQIPQATDFSSATSKGQIGRLEMTGLGWPAVVRRVYPAAQDRAPLTEWTISAILNPSVINIHLAFGRST